MASRKQREKKPDSEPSHHWDLRKACQTRGKVLFKCAFVSIPQSHRDFLTSQVDSWDSDVLTKCGKGGSIRAMNKAMYDISNVEPTDPARYLFLKSGHNDLTQAIVNHISYEYDCRLMKGSNYYSRTGFLMSILNALDNIPPTYGKRDLKWSIVLHLVNNYDYLTKKLKHLLNLTKRSYQNIVQDLIEENELGNSLLFVIGAIRHFLHIPILLILPKIRDDPTVAGGKVFLFERCHLYQEDQFLSKDEF